MAKVSIIVPVYNVENYIDRCLKNLVNQTLKDIEIIVVNDGSTDDSKSIIDNYIEKYQIKYLEKENGGLSSARNFGLRYATGEYVAFLDSDDYVEKNMYEEMYKLAKNENSDMVECDFAWEWDCLEKYEINKKIKKDIRKKYKNKREMMKRPRVVAWNKLIKRSIIEENNIKFPEGLIYEDLEFFYKLIPYVNKISYLNKYFVHYVQREDSISNKQTEKNGDIFKILNNIIEFYKKNNLYTQYKKELNYMFLRILFGSSMKRILKIKDYKLKKELIKETFLWIFQKETVLLQKETVPMKKICFGITKLGIGGAERVLVDIVNRLCFEYDITIFTIYAGGELEKELNKNVNLISLYDKEEKGKFIPLYILIFGKKIYNKFIKFKYDVDIAFLEGPITRIFSYKGNARKIAWIHNDIKKVFGNSWKAKLKNFIDKRVYERYNKIIFVSEDNKLAFESLYGDISDREIIYNYIDKNRVVEKSKAWENDSIVKEFYDECYIKDVLSQNYVPIFLTVSRIVYQKGIDRLIKIHKKLIDNGLLHKIYVIGDGEEKNKLQSLVNDMNIEDTFIFLGKKDNPYPYIKYADYFILLSYYEGYGMVIEEAKILNKPIVITNTAAKEAVKDYSKSLVIENSADEIYFQLKNLLCGDYEYMQNDESNYVYDNEYLIGKIQKILI